jgi:hypothetical protein
MSPICVPLLKNGFSPPFSLGIDLHDFRDPRKVLNSAKVMLKPTGRLIDPDWKRESMEIGPPLSTC